MRKLLKRINSFFERPGDIFNPHAVRREAMPYFLAWIVIFTWLYCYFLPNGVLLFLDENSLTGYEHTNTYIWLIVCPMISTFSKGVHYVSKTMYSVIIALSCFIVMLFFEIEGAVIVFQIVMAFCVGHIFASCGYGFFMILNNSEKFYSMLLGILLPKLILILNPILSKNLRFIKYSDFILLCCLIALLFCSALFYKEKWLIPNVENVDFPKKAWSLMAVVFLVLTFNDVIAPVTLVNMKLELNLPLEIWYFTGILSGLFLVLVLQRVFQLNICLMLNLSMALLAMGFVISTRAEDYSLIPIFSAILFGISYAIGMVNIYYLAGFISKKLQNITFYRIGIILSAAYYFYGYGIAKLFGNSPAVMSMISVCVLILFFSLSPIFMRLLYDGEWIDDTYRSDVTFESRLRARLKDLRLSPKEAEVCELLLNGYTLRQTAAMLEIAYSTANTYCTSLYRKLNINSRTELTLLFKEFID